MSVLHKRDIRRAEWHMEVAEYFGIDKNLLLNSVSKKTLKPEDEPRELKEAREIIRRTFMSEDAIRIHDKILNDKPENIADHERSSSWQDYIFLCINGEHTGFQRMFFYNQIINCIVKTQLENIEYYTVLDYGCGSSLFTRMLSQDFEGRVKTISADVCTHAVGFSVARNKLYNPSATGILIDDVLSSPELSKIDLILAYAVFEHLPNSTHQIQGLINALSPGGILIENYSGHSREIPHKSDTFNSYKSRDVNLDLLNDRLILLYGTLPQRDNGFYAKDIDTRFWIKPGADRETINAMQTKLRKQNTLIKKVVRKVHKFL